MKNGKIRANSPSKEEICVFLENKGINVLNKNLLLKLLENLWESEAKLLLKLFKTINRNYKFHIEVYESDSDLPDLCICIHFPESENDKSVMNTLLSLYKEKEKIDPNNLLWFVGFIDVYENFK